MEIKHLAIIPARSGSKGLIHKNIKKLLGKPLIAYSIEAAIHSGLFDEVMVSTDSLEYAKIAEKYGASIPYLRANDLAVDNASSWDVVKDVIGRYKDEGKTFDTICLLQPTSPLRSAQDIRAAYDMLNQKKADTIVSVTEMEHSPMWVNLLPSDFSMENFIKPEVYDKNRQTLDTYYRINGALYIVKTKHLLSDEPIYGTKSFAYIMSANNSVDIDKLSDFLIAETFLKLSNGTLNQIEHPED